MSKNLPVILFLLFSFILSGCQLIPQNTNQKVSETMAKILPDQMKPTASPLNPPNQNQAIPSPIPATPFTSEFLIYTNGTKRLFTAAMYQHQSTDAYLTDQSAQQIVIEKTGLTWNEFFKTLPVSLDSQCLVTGTGQEFCSGQNQMLSFYLNGEFNPQALDQEILPGDQLLITFGPIKDTRIENQLKSF